MAEVNTQKFKSHRSTSYEEQAIFFYVRQVFPDAINRGDFCFTEDESIELDIYIPSLHIAIEYDGAYWHKNKITIDNHKNLVLSNAGVYLIRIRECGLDELEYNYGDIVYRTATRQDSGLHLNEVINRIFELIKAYIKRDNLNIPPESNKLLETIYISQEKVIEDRPNIYAQYYTTPQEDSIANSCLAKYWDYEKNGNLRPENVSIKSGIYVTLKCTSGHAFLTQLSQLKIRKTKESSKCQECILNYCPALIGTHDCKLNCDIYQKSISTLKYISRSSPIVRSSYNFIKYKKLQIDNFLCSDTIVKNPHYIWLKEKQKFYSKLETEKYTISSNEIVDFFMTINSLGIGRSPFEQFELIDYIASVGKSAPTLIQKTKDILSGKVVKKNKNGSTTDIRIFVDNTLNPDIVIDNLIFWGIEHFSFLSINLFDHIDYMDKFCEITLDSYRRTGFSIKFWSLIDTIKSKCNELSKTFCTKIYQMIYKMNMLETNISLTNCLNALKIRLSQ